MNRREVMLVVGGAAIALAAGQQAQAQTDHPPARAAEPNPRWAQIAESLIPSLVETEQPLLRTVRAEPAPNTPLLFTMQPESTPEDFSRRVMKKGESVILDFGGHRTGHISFRIETEGREPDAPVRLRLTFGEVPTDVAEPLYPYNQEMSTAWLPDEIINVDFLPQSVRLPRRYAFRYVKIDVIDTSPGFGVRFVDVKAHAITSARNTPPALPRGKSELIRRIDEVSIATLRDCMQTTFEDGPRRDQRLWVGDLRLQALTNYVTFNENNLVKRCLYLFAALPREDGLVAACVYEKPYARYGGIHIVDYAALFNVTLADYVDATGDEATGRDLWPVCKRQIEIISGWVGADNLVGETGMWVFIDWSQPLHRSAAIQGVLIFAMKRTLDLARRIGTESEIADYPARIEALSQAARTAYWDARAGVFVSGPERQVSLASQAWMIIAGVPTRAEAARAMRAAMGNASAVRPGTPYLNHYVVEALLLAGLRREARRHMEEYWGGMVRAGADTFWEAYRPDEPLISPYGDRHINSYCHAWSCTPSYLIRKLQIA